MLALVALVAAAAADCCNGLLGSCSVPSISVGQVCAQCIHDFTGSACDYSGTTLVRDAECAAAIPVYCREACACEAPEDPWMPSAIAFAANAVISGQLYARVGGVYFVTHAPALPSPGPVVLRGQPVPTPRALLLSRTFIEKDEHVSYTCHACDGTLLSSGALATTAGSPPPLPLHGTVFLTVPACDGFVSLSAHSTRRRLFVRGAVVKWAPVGAPNPSSGALRGSAAVCPAVQSPGARRASERAGLPGPPMRFGSPDVPDSWSIPATTLGRLLASDGAGGAVVQVEGVLEEVPQTFHLHCGPVEMQFHRMDTPSGVAYLHTMSVPACPTGVWSAHCPGLPQPPQMVWFQPEPEVAAGFAAKHAASM